jgi:hypothetical protein
MCTKAYEARDTAVSRPKSYRAGSGLAALLAGAALLIANEAHAGESAPKSGDAQTSDAEVADAKGPSGIRRALSAGAALVPGLVAHGTGHFVLGEPATGRKLLFAELTGLGLLAAGGIPIWLSGASRYLVGPGAALVMLGVGLFSLSLAADMYGTLAVDGDAASARIRPPPWLEAELGYRYIDDPVFAYEHLVYQRVSLMTGPVRVTPSVWFSTAGNNAQYRLEAAYRVLGPRPSSRGVVSNDRFDMVGGFYHHRYVTEQFARTSGELAIDTRFDLGHVGPTLRGAFIEAQLGVALASIGYSVPGRDVPGDFDSLLLGRLGFGVVLRGKSKPGSEVTVYYDHRHDDFASGFVMPGLASGVLGHVGGQARWLFTRELGISVMAEYGSAFFTGLSVVFRQSADEGPGT